MESQRSKLVMQQRKQGQGKRWRKEVLRAVLKEAQKLYISCVNSIQDLSKVIISAL